MASFGSQAQDIHHAMFADRSPAAGRALAEAMTKALPPELGGRDGLEPCAVAIGRKMGLAVDF